MRTYLFLKGACRLILGCFFSFQLISEREKKNRTSSIRHASDCRLANSKFVIAYLELSLEKASFSRLQWPFFQ